MKTIFGNKKVLTSMSAIVLALVLMTGGTMAWLTVGDFKDQITNFGVLQVEATNIDPSQLTTWNTELNLQPGFYWSEPGEIANTGSLDAIVEVTPGKIFLRNDEFGHPLVPAGRVDAAPATKYALGYEPLSKGGINAIYLHDAASAATVSEGDLVIQHLRVPTTYESNVWDDDYTVILHHVGDPVLDKNGVQLERERHFLLFDAAGNYYQYDTAGNVIYDPVTGKPDWKYVTKVAIEVKAVLDLDTNADKMGKEWNNAYLDGYKVLATQARYPKAYNDVFGLTKDMIDAAEWPSDPPYVSLSRGTKPLLTVKEFMIKHFGVEF